MSVKTCLRSQFTCQQIPDNANVLYAMLIMSDIRYVCIMSFTSHCLQERREVLYNG